MASRGYFPCCVWSPSRCSCCSPLRVRTSSLDVSGDTATGAVDVFAAEKRIRSERVTLVRQGGGWLVTRVTGTVPSTGPAVVLSGPKATRAPTGDERASLSRFVLEYLGIPASCVQLSIAVSSVDSHLASVSERFVGPHANTCGSNGVDVFLRSPTGWHLIGSASEGFECRVSPAGVLRSLFGGCVLRVDPGAR